MRGADDVQWTCSVATGYGWAFSSLQGWAVVAAELNDRAMRRYGAGSMLPTHSSTTTAGYSTGVDPCSRAA